MSLFVLCSTLLIQQHMLVFSFRGSISCSLVFCRKSLMYSLICAFLLWTLLYSFFISFTPTLKPYNYLIATWTYVLCLLQCHSFSACCWFIAILMSCQHTWQCNIQMSHVKCTWQLITAFHKSGKLCSKTTVYVSSPKASWHHKIL